MIRSFRLAAFAAFATLGLVAAPSADAAFSYSTSLTGATGATLSGNTVTVAGLTLNYTLDANSNVTTSGALISTVLQPITGTYTGPATGTNFTVTETITLNGVAAYTETVSYTALPFAVAVITNGVTLVPAIGTSQTIGGTTFTPVSANATGADFNSSGTITTTFVTAAVPEPASVAMLGLGLVGTAGFAARRRLARA